MKQFTLLILSITLLTGITACQNKKIEIPSTTASLRSVYFDYDQALIRYDAATAMKGNADYLKQHASMNVTIEGNCDNRGTNEYNLALAHRRAESTKNYLMNLGINNARLRSISYGEERPVCTQDNESCWQRNRRADFRH